MIVKRARDKRDRRQVEGVVDGISEEISEEADCRLVDEFISESCCATNSSSVVASSLELNLQIR